MSINEANLIDVFREAAHSACRALGAPELDRAQLVGRGAGGDMGTRSDQVAERAITKTLWESQIGGRLLTEETGQVQLPGKRVDDLTIIVDPLDGTNNFKRDFPFSSISIAAYRAREPIAGLVHDVFTGESYVATRGGGTWLQSDGQSRKLFVSGVKDLDKAFVTMIRPVERNRYVELADLFFSVKTVRIVVSAALEMAFVARGVTDAFIDVALDTNLSKGGIRLVDLAAGELLVREAGGVCWSDRLDVDSFAADLSEQTNFIAASSNDLLQATLTLSIRT